MSSIPESCTLEFARSQAAYYAAVAKQLSGRDKDHGRVCRLAELYRLKVKELEEEKMAKIGLYKWIRENRAEIDRAIHSVCPDISLNDEDRRQWIYNDPGLYSWARSEGVNV